MHAWRTWLRPGMFVKRWILLFMLGVVLMSLALAMGLAWLYRNYSFPDRVTNLVRGLTLQFIPHPLREAILLVLGIGLLFVAVWQLSRSLISPLLARAALGMGLAEIVAEHRFGPVRPKFKVVTIGGGTGLPTLLRGLKHHDVAITAIVTVADDGGSTGRIRNEFNMPAPGDIRNCIVALADAESTVGQLFQYRFDQAGSALAGHSFGNLFITALTQITGSFEHAVIESAEVLAVRGRVLPSTLENVTLCADLVDGSTVRGESHIPDETPPIQRVFLDPERPMAYEPALSAILAADLIVLGPGSLYTSVLPNLLVEGIVQAIKWSGGTVAYVCNVATQVGETDHFTAKDHVQAVVDYLSPGVLNYAVVNNNPAAASAIGPELKVEPVMDDGQATVCGGVQIVARDVVSDRNPLRHDPDKLSDVLLELAEASRKRVPPAAIPVSLVGPIKAAGDGAAPVALKGNRPSHEE